VPNLTGGILYFTKMPVCNPDVTLDNKQLIMLVCYVTYVPSAVLLRATAGTAIGL